MIQRNSHQRDTILQVVRASGDHPTADTIYSRVRERAPNVSLGTVYRNLAQLCEAGLVRRIDVPGASGRFDKTLRAHAHFNCRICREVTDVGESAFSGLAETVREKAGHVVESTELLFSGICVRCLQAESVQKIEYKEEK